MDPVFTLQWPEFLLAERLHRHFPKSKHFSVLIPASRQEKGIDLALVHKSPGGSSRVALLQVKSSRTYTREPPKRRTTRRFQFETWFQTFEPSDHADFFLLIGLFAPDSAQTERIGPRWYRDVTLLFTFCEMKDFIDSCRTVRGKGKPDGKFGFGFDDERRIVQTRGDPLRGEKDFTPWLLDNRWEMLKKHFEA